MSDSDFALRLASPAELREMVQTLTRERDEARADLEKVAAAHKMVGSSTDEIAAAVKGLRQAAITQDTANEELVGSLRQSRAENARLRGALERAERALQGIATAQRFDRDVFSDDSAYVDWARSLSLHVAEIARAALAGEKPPVRTFDRHGADRGRWVGVWDAINRYSEACGGSPTAGGPSRMEAVVEVERALDAALAGEGEVEEDTTTIPFCACGRRVSECDGSRAGCGKTPEKARQP